MALYKQNGSKNWWVSIYRPGMPRLRKSTGTDDREKAKAIEATFRMAMRGNVDRDRLISSLDAIMGFDQPETGIPVGEIEEAYRNLPEHREGPETIRTRCAHLRDMASWMSKNWPSARFMHDISREAAIAYGDALRGECRTGKTFNNRRGNLVRVFNLLLVRGGCAENVWKLVPTADTRDSKSGRAFSADEMKRLYSACKAAGHQWHPITVIGRYTGLRYGDIANLTASDIENGMICLRPSKTARKKITVRIPMHPKVEAILPDHSDGPFFPDHAFNDYEERPLKGEYARIIKTAEISPKGAVLSFHCLRHTFRTELAKAGVAQEIAMQLGGWTESDTAELYNHDLSQLKNAIALLD